MKISPEMKKRLLFAIPLVILFYFTGKLAELFRLAAGAGVYKLTNTLANLPRMLDNPLPSLHPYDLLFALVCTGAVLGIIYARGKKSKKFRQDVEYGSARWGTAADIKPYMDKDPWQNVILTQTEGLMMGSRPKNPKHARNKNVLVIGGSGSGKTRFWLKPNLMQLHSSYVVTDPKGTVLVECGTLLQKAKYRIRVLNTINFNKSMHYNRATRSHTTAILQG